MKRTTHAKYAAAALAGTTVLAACGTETVGAGTEDVSTIADTSWVPRKVTVDGKDYVLPEKGARRHAHIEFDPGTAEPDVGGGKSGGSVGCNSIGADVDIEGDTVKVSDLVRTLIGCGGALGTFEEKFVGVFDNDLEAELKGRSGARTLTLTSPQNDTITLREEQAPPSRALAGPSARSPTSPSPGTTPSPAASAATPSTAGPSSRTAPSSSDASRPRA